MPSDFRKGMIRRRLKKVKRVILVMSGKGGVGKSVVSATLAAILAQAGLKVGILDADVYGPSSTLLFNTNEFPREERSGLVPPLCSGVRVMSIDLFAAGGPVPLTGAAAIQAETEMLALTDWGDLDCLIVDTPPSTGDIMLFLTSLDKRKLAALVVTTPDKLSANVARRVLALLRSDGTEVLGVLGNMSREGAGRGSRVSRSAKGLARRYGAPLLGVLPFDDAVLLAVEKGDMEMMLKTRFARGLQRSVKELTDGSLRPLP